MVHEIRATPSFTQLLPRPGVQARLANGKKILIYRFSFYFITWLKRHFLKFNGVIPVGCGRQPGDLMEKYKENWLVVGNSVCGRLYVASHSCEYHKLTPTKAPGLSTRLLISLNVTGWPLEEFKRRRLDPIVLDDSK